MSINRNGSYKEILLPLTHQQAAHLITNIVEKHKGNYKKISFECYKIRRLFFDKIEVNYVTMKNGL